uniref:Cytochrome P450 CYP76AD13 n=1 Tax=Basella alba TaxID=3589 RepID=A0A0U1YLS0_BASAL|nr:cytochrome P450 CYP76AD13 [Basella alba]
MGNQTTMELYTTLTLFISIVSFLFLHHFLKNSPKSKLPPGPKPWPIIGNIHLLGSKPHCSVANLSKIYGPVMSLKLGSIVTIVISSPKVAKEMFLKHDSACSSRRVPDCFKIIGHEQVSMVWLPANHRWRNLRKISATQLFTNLRLDANQGLRREKINDLIQFVKDSCGSGLAIDIGKAAFTTSLNLLSNTFFSVELASYDSSISHEFKELVWRVLEVGATPNISDFFPLIRTFDLQGTRRRGKYYLLKLRGIFEKIIDERLSCQTSGKDDVLDTLLKLVKQNELSLHEVQHFLIDLFVAGTDTTSSVLEWAMTELLRNPEKMGKLQNEINNAFGNDQSKSIQESDISKLPYLQGVVKETLRLHPPAPFLLPRKVEKDIDLVGYHVPKNSTIWVNVWSMGRDPSNWSNPEVFMPERFLDSEIDVKSRHSELIPFGAGRRICPGLPLAYRMVHLMLANLVQFFNWKVDRWSNPEEIDMEEKFGITLQKAKPLEVVPILR